MTFKLDTELMRELRGLGITDAELGRLTGLSRERVGQLIGRSGVRDAPPDGIGDPDAEADARLPGMLLEWRRRRRLSQPKAAALLGINIHTWNAWETGRRKCGLAGTVLRLLSALDAIDASLTAQDVA